MRKCGEGHGISGLLSLLKTGLSPKTCAAWWPPEPVPLMIRGQMRLIKQISCTGSTRGCMRRMLAAGTIMLVFCPFPERSIIRPYPFQTNVSGIFFQLLLSKRLINRIFPKGTAYVILNLH
jgi:hypothetical protein